jgi:hypothetical protein
MTLDTALTTVGDLVFSECRQEAGSRPTLLVRTCGEGGPHQLDGGQAQLAHPRGFGAEACLLMLSPSNRYMSVPSQRKEGA